MSSNQPPIHNPPESGVSTASDQSPGPSSTATSPTVAAALEQLAKPGVMDAADNQSTVREVAYPRQKLSGQPTGSNSMTPATYLREAFESLSKQYDALGISVSARVGAQTLQFSNVNVRVPAGQSAITDSIAQLLGECRGGTDTLVRTESRTDGTPEITYVAVPLGDNRDDEIVGTCALAISGISELETRVFVAELQAATMMIHNAASARMAPIVVAKPLVDGTEEKRLTAIARVSHYRDTTEFAFTLVNSIAQRFDFDLVTFGAVQGPTVVVTAVSGVDTIKSNSPGIVELQQVMSEAFDHGVRIQCNLQNQSDQHSVPPIHRHWARSNQSVVASIPVFDGDRCVAVISVRNAQPAGISDEQLNDLESNVSVFGPAIEVMKRSDRSLTDHAKSALRGTGRAAISPKTRSGIVGRLAIAAAVLFFAFGRLTYEPSTSCTIVPSNLTQCLAPFDMILAGVHVRSGDEVTAGTLLASFDTRDLDLEHAGLAAELNKARVDVRAAIAAGDAAAAAVSNANVDVLETKIDILDQRLKRCQVLAPTDGMVVEVDLNRRLGQVFAQGEKILAFAPTDAWSLDLQIPEHVARHIQSGQTGTFAAVSHPNQKLNYVIESVSGAASVVDGENVFVATAKIDGDSDWMRFGMEGVAATDTGKRPVIWIAMHRVWEIARLKFWL